MHKPILIALILITAGCGLSPRARFWYHPERTLEQARQNVEQCYEEAFLTEQSRCYSPGSAQDRSESLMYVEITTRQCMKQAGYSRIPENQLDATVREQTGTVHGVTYFIAGQ